MFRWAHCLPEENQDDFRIEEILGYVGAVLELTLAAHARKEEKEKYYLVSVCHSRVPISLHYLPHKTHCG